MKPFLAACAMVVIMAMVAGLVVGQAPPVEEICDGDTDQLKRFAGMRARDCPEGYVGQWFQEREAGGCDWRPAEPQWYACSIVIEPVEVPSEVPPTPLN